MNSNAEIKFVKLVSLLGTNRALELIDHVKAIKSVLNKNAPTTKPHTMSGRIVAFVQSKKGKLCSLDDMTKFIYPGCKPESDEFRSAKKVITVRLTKLVRTQAIYRKGKKSGLYASKPV